MREIKTVEERTCDHCGKFVSDKGELRIGGSVFHGWFIIEKTNGSTRIVNFPIKNKFDICCSKCLKESNLLNDTL